LAAPAQSDFKVLGNDAERRKEIRERLSDFSWFRRALAEPIAWLANRQDDWTGRFWEGRFNAYRIVDEALRRALNYLTLSTRFCHSPLDFHFSTTSLFVVPGKS
jgi:hypothetical protein